MLVIPIRGVFSIKKLLLRVGPIPDKILNPQREKGERISSTETNFLRKFSLENGAYL
jgi:hypothetical protein